MDYQEVVNRLEKMVDILDRMPNKEMSLLIGKISSPEPIREWGDYNNEGSQDKLDRSIRIRPTPKDIEQAMETAELVRYACNKRDNPGTSFYKIIMCIIFEKARGRSLREITLIIRDLTGKRYGKTTVDNWFKRAVSDIQRKKSTIG